jgi:outer membrane autotransporter protein
VLQGTFYRGTAATEFSQLPANGTGFVSSLETGYPIKLPLGPQFVLEPQAQIIWQQVTFNDANDGSGTVALGTTSGPTGRLGVRGQWSIVDQNAALWQPYAGVNFWRDWSGEATTTYSGVDQVPLIEQSTWAEFFGGVTTKIDARLSFYGQGGYQSGLDSLRRSAFYGDVGLRYTW